MEFDKKAITGSRGRPRGVRIIGSAQTNPDKGVEIVPNRQQGEPEIIDQHPRSDEPKPHVEYGDES